MVFNKTTLHNRHCSLIFPHIPYCIEVWGPSSYCHFSILFKLQKKIAHLVSSIASSSLYKRGVRWRIVFWYRRWIMPLSNWLTALLPCEPQSRCMIQWLKFQCIYKIDQSLWKWLPVQVTWHIMFMSLMWALYSMHFYVWTTGGNNLKFLQDKHA